MSNMSMDAIEQYRFREILGHSPTSVAAITALDKRGEPIGMVVGTFNSVSLDPPLVGFYPDKGSSTFPQIREASFFCVNVLAASQEDVCRRMSSRRPDRFSGIPWHPSPGGAPIIDDCIAWIECRPEATHEAGDHFIFIGRVTAMEVMNPTYPLVFFQGGYGAFAPTSLVIGAREGLSEQIRLADLARSDMERLATEIGAECRLIAADGDRQMVVASMGNEERAPSRLVGVSMPAVPPFGQLFKAWGTADEIEAWMASSPTSVDDERRAVFLNELDTVRREGWMGTYPQGLDTANPAVLGK